MKLRFGTHLATIAHLVVLSWLGIGVITGLATLLTAGIATALALGFGLLLLALLALGVFAAAWLERLRVRGLYGIDIPEPGFAVSERTDWLRVPHTLWLQIASGRNLIAVLHLAITSAIGLVAVWLITVAGTGIGMLFAPFAGEAPVMLPFGGFVVSPWVMTLLGVVSLLLAIAGLAGLSIAHRAIAGALLVPDREEELRRVAQSATRQREGAVHAAEVERTRIERDLHDGVQPRLVSIAMTLGLAKQRIETDPAGATALIDEAHTSTKAAVTELRQLARGIHTSVLDDRGLDAALSALAARSHIPVTLDVRLDGRCSRASEAAMYFVVAESLTNAAKHSKAQGVRVLIRLRDGGTLWGRVEDDGIGGAVRTPGGGIDGIAGRVTAAGGTFTIDSPHGGPTTLEVSLPCAS